MIGAAIRRATLAAVVTVLACGCGTDSERSAVGDGAAGQAAGARVFAEAGCGDCHTLAAARSTGTVGPNFDQARPSRGDVLRQVSRGGIGMPSFSGKLSAGEIEAVAAFVSSSAGGVQLAASFKPDDTTVASCSGDFRCLEQAFGNLAYGEGPKAALTEFDRRIAADSTVEANCHRIAHMIGAASLEHFDGSVGKAFAAGSASCWSGYYHGILERAFAGVPDSELAPVSRTLCSDAEIRRTSFIAYQCVHGLGHGLMIYTSYDLPRALQVCDGLNGSWDQVSCTGGVFMENISSSYGVKSRWLKDDNLMYPCDWVAERHKVYCYLMVTSRILPAVGYDFGKTAAMCHRAETNWVATCFQSLGRDASGQTRQNPVRIRELCAESGRMAAECLYGAARDMTSNYAGGRQAATLCAAAEVEYRDRCFNGIGTIIGTLEATPAERRAACEQIGGRYVPACLRGAGV